MVGHFHRKSRFGAAIIPGPRGLERGMVGKKRGVEKSEAKGKVEEKTGEK